MRGAWRRGVAKDIARRRRSSAMLDIVNNELEAAGKEPIAFEHDCREGICGSCGMMIDGLAHGPEKGVTTCQLYMRNFKDGATIYVEPFRAKAFPGTMISSSTARRSTASSAQAAISPSMSATCAGRHPLSCVSKIESDSFSRRQQQRTCREHAASCKNASAMLFTSAKISHLVLLPQGVPERRLRALNMVETMDAEGFGNCTNEGECEAKCPKEISLANIARMNWRFGVSSRCKGKKKQAYDYQTGLRNGIFHLSFSKLSFVALLKPLGYPTRNHQVVNDDPAGA